MWKYQYPYSYLLPIDPNPVEIFRVQNIDGDGPYNQAEALKLSSHNGDVDEHPTPIYDVGRRMSDVEKCGFINLDDLFKWFTDEQIDLMETKGFHIIQTKGWITGWGNFQVLFVPYPT